MMKPWQKVLFGATLSLIFVFISVGYASLSDDLEINGNIDVAAQYDVFILSVTTDSDGQIPFTDCSYYGTYLEFPANTSVREVYVHLYNNNVSSSFYFSNLAYNTSAGYDFHIYAYDALDRNYTTELPTESRVVTLSQKNDSTVADLENTVTLKLTLNGSYTGTNSIGVNLKFYADDAVFQGGPNWWPYSTFDKTIINKIFFYNTPKKVEYTDGSYFQTDDHITVYKGGKLTYYAADGTATNYWPTYVWQVAGTSKRPVYAFVLTNYYVADDGGYYNLLGIVGGDESGTLYAGTDMSYTFAGFTGLNTEGWAFKDTWRLNTSRCVTMESMFEGSSMADGDIIFNDTQNLQSMKNMFKNCTNLERTNLSNFKTTNVTDFSGLFDGCVKLHESFDYYADSYGNAQTFKDTLNLSYFDFSNAQDTSNMFRSCSAMTKLNADFRKTSNNYNTSGMFQNCSALTALPSAFDCSNVTDFSYMFDNCLKITSVNLSAGQAGVDAEKKLDYMFHNCSKLTSIDFRKVYIVNSTTATMFAYDSGVTVEPLYVYYTPDLWVAPPDGFTTWDDDSLYNNDLTYNQFGNRFLYFKVST